MSPVYGRGRSGRDGGLWEGRRVREKLPEGGWSEENGRRQLMVIWKEERGRMIKEEGKGRWSGEMAEESWEM